MRAAKKRTLDDVARKRLVSPADGVAAIKRGLAELLIEVDRLQARAMDVECGAINSKGRADRSGDETGEIADGVNWIVCDLEIVGAALARLLLLPPRVARAELLAARAGIAIESPGVWRALGEVAKSFGESAVGGTAVEIDADCMAEATLAIACNAALMTHPSGAICEGHGMYLRLEPDGSPISWSTIATRFLAAAVPIAVVKANDWTDWTVEDWKGGRSHRRQVGARFVLCVDEHEGGSERAEHGVEWWINYQGDALGDAITKIPHRDGADVAVLIAAAKAAAEGAARAYGIAVPS